MLRLYAVFALSALGFCRLSAQANQPDTLLNEPVLNDPTDTMIIFPSGDDAVWINYDEDLAEGFCRNQEPTPNGWYTEADFGVPDPSTNENLAFTSCSYLAGGVRNNNWLILPPLFIPDSSYRLCWRSLSFEGPAYTDGYEVVASIASNIPESGDFSVSLFRAAEMVKPVTPGVFTLDPADYVFSDGYVHANGYTDTNYYFLLPPNGPFRGKLEPHCIDLKAFAGQTLYLAFHHDSKDDSQLQIDDILIANSLSTDTRESGNLSALRLFPNPATDLTYLQWDMKQPEAGTLVLLDNQGRQVLNRTFGAYSSGSFFLDLRGLSSGIYTCRLLTRSGSYAQKLVKLGGLKH